MMREQYYIVRLDVQLVPTVVAYVGHCEPPYDMKLRWMCFRDSATEYSSKRDAIREVKRLAKIFTGFYWKVNGAKSRHTYFSISVISGE